MKKIVVAALFAALAFTGLSTLPASATAGDSNPKNCTVREYRAVKKGMNKKRVARILDSRGVQEYAFDAPGYHSETRKYGAGLYNSWCWVNYVNGRVDSKTRA